MLNKRGSAVGSEPTTHTLTGAQRPQELRPVELPLHYRLDRPPTHNAESHPNAEVSNQQPAKKEKKLAKLNIAGRTWQTWE